MPRGYGVAAVLWRKSIDNLVTDISDGSNRIQSAEVSGQVPLLIVSVLLPCRGLRENVEEFADCIAQLNGIYQGPVVQSIVSLTSSLRGQLVKCFTTLQPNTLKFFVEKMREAFALQKLLTFFQQKYWHV